MNKLYDNGTRLLGTKKDILEYIKRQNEAQIIEEEDYKEIVDTLNELVGSDTIVAINYDFGMGMTFDWWTKEDIIESECY